MAEARDADPTLTPPCRWGRAAETGPTASRPKALVLGSDNGSFLSVVRSLGRRGIEVHIGWCPATAPAARSRYVHRIHRLPRPSGDDRWIEPFTAVMEQERFDLVLPTNDPTLIPLQVARGRLEPHGQLYLLNERAFEITFDKVKTRRLAVASGVPVAPGQEVAHADEIEGALEGRPYPLVIRPQRSFCIDDLEGRNSVTRVYDASAARAAILERLPRGIVLVEENVNGVGWGVEVLAAGGEILLSQQHERLHEPLEGGGSSYRRTVARDPGFMRAVSCLIRELDYTGVAMFEFKGVPGTDRWVLIEINGRFWGSLALSLASGIDFPYALWQLLVDGRREFADGYRPGVYARNLKRDLKWMWLNLRANRDDPVLATVPLPRVAAEAANLARRREHSDQFTIDDPGPGWAEFGELGNRLVELGRGRMRAHTPLRRRHQQRARSALTHSNSLLFVCYGNICRSPFAAGFARRTLPGSVRITSAGTLDVEGRRSPALAREVARELGVDLQDHTSHAVTPELVDGAEAIFVFDEQNRRELLGRFPAARPRLHLLGALGPGPLIVEDPINGDARDYRRIYRQIADALAYPGSPART